MKRYLQSYSLLHHYAHAPGFGIHDVLERAAAGGYDGVSININGPGYRQLGGTSAAHIAGVAEHLAALGLACDLETSGTGLAHVTEILGVCSALGARRLRTYMRHEGTVAETMARTVADLREVGRRCADAGVDLLVENHEDFTGAELAAILDDVAHPAIGALVDYGNSMMVGEEPMVALAALLPHVRSAHVKDHACVAGPEGATWVLGVPIGSGTVPLAALTEALRATPCEVAIVSNVFAYRAPVRSWRGGATPGEGVFRLDAPPFDPLLRPWNPLPPKRLVALEAEALALGEAALANLL